MEEEILFLRKVVKTLRNKDLIKPLPIESTANAIEIILNEIVRLSEFEECCREQYKLLTQLKSENSSLKRYRKHNEKWRETAEIYQYENRKLKAINEALCCMSTGSKVMNDMLKKNWVHKMEIIDIKNYYTQEYYPNYEEEKLIEELVEKFNKILK